MHDKTLFLSVTDKDRALQLCIMLTLDGHASSDDLDLLSRSQWCCVKVFFFSSHFKCNQTLWLLRHEQYNSHILSMSLIKGHNYVCLLLTRK